MVGLYSRKNIRNKTAIEQEIPAVTNAGKYVNMRSRALPAANAAAAEPIQSYDFHLAFNSNRVLLI